MYHHSLKPGLHCAIFKSPLGLYLSDCTNMMIMSHYGIAVIINVRLYDSQEELKTGARKKTCPEFYMINPYTFSDWELCCNYAAISAYLRRIVYAALHTRMKTAAQPVFI